MPAAASPARHGLARRPLALFVPAKGPPKAGEGRAGSFVLSRSPASAGGRRSPRSPRAGGSGSPRRPHRARPRGRRGKQWDGAGLPRSPRKAFLLLLLAAAGFACPSQAPGGGGLKRYYLKKKTKQNRVKKKKILQSGSLLHTGWWQGEGTVTHTHRDGQWGSRAGPAWAVDSTQPCPGCPPVAQTPTCPPHPQAGLNRSFLSSRSRLFWRIPSRTGARETLHVHTIC